MLNKFRPFPWGLGGTAAQLLPQTITMGSPSPGTGSPGTSVTMPGTGFGGTTGTVTLHGVPATVTLWTPTSITFTVPSQVSYPDTSPVVVTTHDGRIDTGPNFVTTAAYLFKASGFDGTTSVLVSTAAGLREGSSDFSVAAWVWIDPAMASKGQVVGRNAFGVTDWFLSILANGHAQMEIWSTVPALTTAVSAGALSTSAWHLLVAVVDQTANTCSLSVDGGAFVTSAALTGAMSGGNIAFSLGARSDGASVFFKGRIDETGYWIGRKLSAGDVTALYNGGAGLAYSDLAALGLTTTLTAYWDHDEASGANRLDASGNGFTLTQSGVTQVVGIK